MVAVTGGGKSEMIALAARLKDADRTLSRALRADLRAAAAPVVGRTRAAIESLPSHHGGELRAEMAATVRASVSLGVRSGVQVTIVSAGSKMPPGKGNLPKWFDIGLWHHPVFARGERVRGKAVGKDRRTGRLTYDPPGWTWVTQTGKPGWFEGTIGASQPAFAAGVQRSLDDLARYLEGH